MALSSISFFFFMIKVKNRIDFTRTVSFHVIFSLSPVTSGSSSLICGQNCLLESSWRSQGRCAVGLEFIKVHLRSFRRPHTTASRWTWWTVLRNRPVCQWQGRCRWCPLPPAAGWCWRQPQHQGCAWPRPWASPGLRADTRRNPPGQHPCWIVTAQPRSSCFYGRWGCRWRSTFLSRELWTDLEDKITISKCLTHYIWISSILRIYQLRSLKGMFFVF